VVCTYLLLPNIVPDGPTAHYRISSLVLGQDNKVRTMLHNLQTLLIVLACISVVRPRCLCFSSLLLRLDSVLVGCLCFLLLVFNEDRKEVNGLLHVHLPDGPTAHYRISSLVLGQDIKVWTAVWFHLVSLVLACGMYVLVVAIYCA
jgi:hypothetical protein